MQHMISIKIKNIITPQIAKTYLKAGLSICKTFGSGSPGFAGSWLTYTFGSKVPGCKILLAFAFSAIITSYSSIYSIA